MIADLQQKYQKLTRFLARIFSWENILALMIALILIAIFITTAADAPIWLYQGF